MDDLIERLKDIRHLTQGDGLAALIETANEAATRLAEVEAERDALRAALGMYGRLLLPVHMTLAERDMCEEPLPDTAVLFSFMGSGASDHSTVGDFRKASDAARAALGAKP